jgi:hypothetical protein
VLQEDGVRVITGCTLNRREIVKYRGESVTETYMRCTGRLGTPVIRRSVGLVNAIGKSGLEASKQSRAVSKGFDRCAETRIADQS